MGIVAISEEKALELRAQFDAARNDIRGDCRRYHYPLLEIWRAIDSSYAAPLPKETLDSIGIPAREFQELHALAFTKETIKGSGGVPEAIHKRVYIDRHRTCADISTPDSFGNLLPENILAHVRRNIVEFETKNPEYKL